jgi:hypothetical protein
MKGLVMVVELFEGSNGQVCCPDHVGHYAQSVLAVYPDAGVVNTPLGDWVRLSFVERDEWVRMMADHGREGCEVCESRKVGGW